MKLKNIFVLIVSLPIFISFGCGQQQPAASSGIGALLASEMASSPVQNMVVWTVNEQGEKRSYWVRGSRAGLEIIAARDGVVMPWNQTAWLLEETEIDVQLCDCRAWELLQFQGDCPLAVDPAHRPRISLVNLTTEQKIALLPLHEPDLETQPLAGEILSFTNLVASLGNYLFLLNKEQTKTCDGASIPQADEILIFDLENQKFATLLGDEEQEKLKHAEQTTAFEQVRSELLSDMRGPNDLALTGITPWYNDKNELRITYGFTARASFDTKGDPQAPQSSYSQLIEVQSASIPRALLPYSAVPAIVRVFAATAPAMNRARIGGWFPVMGAPDEIAALLSAFAKAPADKPD
jgi:hypothetical protein